MWSTSIKVEQLRERQWVLLGRGDYDLADTLAYEKNRYERTLEFMEARRDNRNPENTATDTSRNPEERDKINKTLMEVE